MKANFEVKTRSNDQSVPVVHILADHTGDTAAGVIHAASEQFDIGAVRVARLAKISNLEEVRAYFDAIEESDVPTAVFHTIVDEDLRKAVRDELNRRGIPSIDVLGPAIAVISNLTGQKPKGKAGIKHGGDERYNRRVKAMQFFVDHDDGHNPQDLGDADIVLMGVSRTNKTPLSMYLAFLGYKVANVDLSIGSKVPDELRQIDPSRIFGLVSSSNLLAHIRQTRLSDDAAFALAGSYADPDEIDVELAEATKLMDELGCVVINVENRAVEETASEIIERVRALQREQEGK